MPPQKIITVKDVAKHAEVSPATVSRVVNGNGYVMPEKKERVLRAIDELGYQVSSVKSMGCNAKTILLIVNTFRNHACSYYVDGVETAARKLGYEVFIKQIDGFEISVGDIESAVGQCQAAGIIFFADNIEESVVSHVAVKMPAVCMLSQTQIVNATCLNLDEYAMIKRGVAHLIAGGKKKIALINGQKRFKRYEAIEEIYGKVLQEYGLESHPLWILRIDTNYFSTSAASSAKNVLLSGNPPDAFLCVNDVYAAGAVSACKNLGLMVPDDVAIIGHDNTAICHVFDPPLTSFNISAEEIGYMACSNVV